MKNSNIIPLYFIAGLYIDHYFKFMRLSLLRPESLKRKNEDIFTLEEMNLIINKLKDNDIVHYNTILGISNWSNLLNYFNNENEFDYERSEYGKELPLDLPMPDYTLLCK